MKDLHDTKQDIRCTAQLTAPGTGSSAVIAGYVTSTRRNANATDGYDQSSTSVFAKRIQENEMINAQTWKLKSATKSDNIQYCSPELFATQFVSEVLLVEIVKFRPYTQNYRIKTNLDAMNDECSPPLRDRSLKENVLKNIPAVSVISVVHCEKFERTWFSETVTKPGIKLHSVSSVKDLNES